MQTIKQKTPSQRHKYLQFPEFKLFKKAIPVKIIYIFPIVSNKTGEILDLPLKCLGIISDIIT